MKLPPPDMDLIDEVGCDVPTQVLWIVSLVILSLVIGLLLGGAFR